MSCNLNEERLLCLIVLDDRYAHLLSYMAAPAFFRAFIVRSRTTALVTMRMRFKYANGERPWYEVTLQKPEQEALEDFRAGIDRILNVAAAAIGCTLPPGAVLFFYPPDDEGDGSKTIEWLQKMDLIEKPEVLSADEAKARGIL
jgi:hypothetical protein